MEGRRPEKIPGDNVKRFAHYLSAAMLLGHMAMGMQKVHLLYPLPMLHAYIRIFYMIQKFDLSMICNLNRLDYSKYLLLQIFALYACFLSCRRNYT